MGKRIYVILVALLAFWFLWIVVQYGRQPSSETRAPLAAFQNTSEMADVILQNLEPEIRENPILILGVETDRPEHFELWKEFLSRNQKPGLQYDVLVLDQNVETGLFPEAARASVKDGFEEFARGVQTTIDQGKRIAVMVPTVYAVQMIESNFVNNLKTRTGMKPLTLALSDLPRSRPDEKSLRHRCSVEGVDMTGLGPFGCEILQIARDNYRATFSAGQRIALIRELGPLDFIILTTIEK